MKLSEYYKDNASYSKELSLLLGSVVNAIILEACIKRCILNKGPFMLFPRPCTNESYVKGLSWEESYGITSEDLKEALKQIGTQIKKDVSKETVLSENMPNFNIQGELLNKNKLVMYWKNYKGEVFFDVNSELIRNLFIIDKDGTWKDYIFTFSEEKERVINKEVFKNLSSFKDFELDLELDKEVANAE